MKQKKPKIYHEGKLILTLVLLFVCGFALHAQQITGKVTSNEGEPLPGVNIVVQGTTIGTTTDLNGNYTIKTSDSNASLVFSFVGYLTETTPVSNRVTVNVSLVPELKTLDEVVVVGYGTQKKRDVTGAITSVTDKSIQQRQAVNIFDALQGAAAGVQVSSASGAPGASNTIMIRGASTFDDAGVSPLYVVDNVVTEDISSINPNDIKSIEILKDAASGAIYGARSANGVVIITTKSGESGAPRITVQALRSYSTIANKIPQVNAFEQVLNDPSTRGSVLEKFKSNADSVGLINSTSYFYQDLLTRTAIRNDVNFGISGGTEKIKFMASAGFLNDEGIILTSYNNKFTGRMNVDYQATSKFKSMTRISFSKSKTNSIDDGSVLQTSMRRPPNMIIYYPDGTFAPYYAMGGNKNPIQELYDRKNLDERFQGTIYQAVEYKIIPSLLFQASATANLSLRREKEFASRELDSNGDENLRKNTASDNNILGQTYQGEAYLTFNKTFWDNHKINIMAGSSVETGRNDYLNYSGSYFVSEEVYSMNLGTLDLAETNTTASDYAIAGFFGRFGYSYKGKYMLNSNFRYDGSSRFGTKNRWGFFPSASLGWRFSDESFMNWAKSWLSDGKLRATWGITGNDRVGYYESQMRYTAGKYAYNGVQGVVPVTTYGNQELQWEETQQTNFGLDLVFFDGRINFNSDYYIKETKDLLSDLNLPYTTGFDKKRVNLASIQNKGLEFSLTLYPIRTNKVSWQTSVNWWKNNNTITSLSRENYIQSGYYYVAKGYSAGLFYGYKNLGIYEYDLSNAYSEDYKTRLLPVLERDNNNNVIIGLNGQPNLLYYTLPSGEKYEGAVAKITSGGVIAGGGDVIWENMPDQNGVYDSKIDDNDRTILVKATPDWYASWSNTVSYKDFTLSFNFYTSWGGLVYNKLQRYYVSWGGNTHMQLPDYIRTGWKYQGQITDWYAINTRDRKTNNRAELSDQFLEDATFIRLRNARLTYKINSKLLNKTFIKACDIYVYGNNLLTWTNYSGFDPEIGGGVLTPGTDGSAYPRKRELGFGLNLNF